MFQRLAIAALILIQAAPAFAAGQDERPSFGAGRSDQVAPAGPRAPLKQVIMDLGRKNPGRYVNTTLGDQGGRPVYRVQWLMPNGRMVVFVVDAESGATIGREGG